MGFPVLVKSDAVDPGDRSIVSDSRKSHPFLRPPVDRPQLMPPTHPLMVYQPR